MRLETYLINKQPQCEVGKHDMRRSFRGKRAGRKHPTTRVRRGAARARWAIREAGYPGQVVDRTYRTAKDADRAARRIERAMALLHERTMADIRRWRG